MTPTQIAYILATPLQQPMEACWIAFQARAGSSGDFAIFARQNKRLFERKRNCADTIFLYRLTEEGADMKRGMESAASGMEARRAAAENTDAVHDSPTPQGDAQ